MRLATLQSVVSDRDVGLSGSPLPPSPHRFGWEKRYLSSTTVPLELALKGSSSRRLRSPSEYVRPKARREHMFEAPCMGLPSLSATSAGSVVMMSIPSPPPSVLGVSHALNGLIRHQPLWVYFTPQPRPGFTLQGFSLQHRRFIFR